MTIQAIVVFVLLAAIVVPVILSEMNRRGPRRPSTPPAPIPPKREPAAKPPLRLVVNKNDMDRELAALLAKDSRKLPETDD